MAKFEYAPAPESRAIVSLRESYGLFINGEFTPGTDGRVFKTIAGQLLKTRRAVWLESANARTNLSAPSASVQGGVRQGIFCPAAGLRQRF